MSSHWQYLETFAMGVLCRLPPWHQKWRDQARTQQTWKHHSMLAACTGHITFTWICSNIFFLGLISLSGTIIHYISAVPISRHSSYLFLEFAHIQPQTPGLLAHIQWVVPKAPLYHHYTNSTLQWNPVIDTSHSTSHLDAARSMPWEAMPVSRNHY